MQKCYIINDVTLRIIFFCVEILHLIDCEREHINNELKAFEKLQNNELHRIEIVVRTTNMLAIKSSTNRLPRPKGFISSSCVFSAAIKFPAAEGVNSFTPDSRILRPSPKRACVHNNQIIIKISVCQATSPSTIYIFHLFSSKHTSHREVCIAEDLNTSLFRLFVVSQQTIYSGTHKTFGISRDPLV